MPEKKSVSCVEHINNNKYVRRIGLYSVQQSAFRVVNPLLSMSKTMPNNINFNTYFKTSTHMEFAIGALYPLFNIVLIQIMNICSVVLLWQLEGVNVEIRGFYARA